ncbi:hypothetical protein [Candidatus Poriferisocius sp.]|uniref:hypothetical protein n=1 Tax=Candidatus Poriferisocius sp. TaxID=3101276 RepID=UPI003B018F3B
MQRSSFTTARPGTQRRIIAAECAAAAIRVVQHNGGDTISPAAPGGIEVMPEPSAAPVEQPETDRPD